MARVIISRHPPPWLTFACPPFHQRGGRGNAFQGFCLALYTCILAFFACGLADKQRNGLILTAVSSFAETS